MRKAMQAGIICVFSRWSYKHILRSCIPQSLQFARFNDQDGPAEMQHRKSGIIITLLVAATLSGCATGPVPPRTPSKVALITAGHFRGGTSFGRDISVLEVDGKPTDRPYGPIELVPGAHSVTMKCGDTVKARPLTVAAGEVYQFSIVTVPGVKGCSGSLTRVRPARKMG